MTRQKLPLNTRRKLRIKRTDDRLKHTEMVEDKRRRRMRHKRYPGAAS